MFAIHFFLFRNVPLNLMSWESEPKFAHGIRGWIVAGFWRSCGRKEREWGREWLVNLNELPRRLLLKSWHLCTQIEKIRYFEHNICCSWSHHNELTCVFTSLQAIRICHHTGNFANHKSWPWTGIQKKIWSGEWWLILRLISNGPRSITWKFHLSTHKTINIPVEQEVGVCAKDGPNCKQESQRHLHELLPLPPLFPGEIAIRSSITLGSIPISETTTGSQPR